jgi:hypothetical protein
MDSTQDYPVATNEAQYDVEVLCAGWNPLVAAVAEPVAAARGLIAELTGVDIETFLARFYQSQQG